MSSVGRSTIGSLLSGLASQGGLLISGILSSRILGPEDRGHLSLLILAPLVLCHIGGLGLPLAVTYVVGKAPASAAAVARLLARPTVIQLLVVGIVEIWVLRTYVEGRGAPVQQAAVLCGLLLPSWLASEFGYAFLQGQQRFAAFNVVRSWSKALHAVILLAMFALGIGTLPLVAASWLAVSWLETTVTLAVVARGIAWASSVRTAWRWPEMARFGLTALPGAISPIETLRLDQAMVGWLMPPAAVGIYVTAGAVTNPPRFVAQSVGVITYPYVAGLGLRAQAWRAAWRFFWLAFALALTLAVVIAAAADMLIPWLFGEAFAAAAPVAQILLLASALASGRRVLADGARGLGYPALGTAAEVISWCTILATAPYLLGRNGTAGMAAALALGAGVGLATLVVGLNTRRRRGQGMIAMSTANDGVALVDRP